MSENSPKTAPKYFELGALAPPIDQQLIAMGVVLSGPDVARFQMQADAVTTLKIAQLIPASAAETARKRIVKEIVQVALRERELQSAKRAKRIPVTGRTDHTIPNASAAPTTVQ